MVIGYVGTISGKRILKYQHRGRFGVGISTAGSQHLNMLFQRFGKKIKMIMYPRWNQRQTGIGITYKQYRNTSPLWKFVSATRAHTKGHLLLSGQTCVSSIHTKKWLGKKRGKTLFTRETMAKRHFLIFSWAFFHVSVVMLTTDKWLWLSFREFMALT